ncbi:MAG: cytochrome c-type biogenesis protein CcmH [Neisseriaceae bacterium]|nr:cytochrome c-type biogenesis protein CcmH [Neisseriaceae bacterium]
MSGLNRLLALALALWLPCLSAAAAPLSEAVVDQRLQQLSKELRCLVCQNESLAESPAGLADDLRREVRGQIESGQSDAEIKAYLVARYGYFVMYEPPWLWQTLWLWLTPFVILLGLGGWLLWQLRRPEPRAVPPPQTGADTAAALAKLKQEFEREQT